MILDNIQSSLRLVLAAPVVAHQLAFVGSYADGNANNYTPAPFSGASADVDPVTMVAAPPSGIQRQIIMFTVSNRDTAQATATISFVDQDVLTQLYQATLDPGDVLVYTQSSGFAVKTATGAQKVTPGGPTTLDGDVTGSGTGSIATTIATGAVGTTKLADGAVSTAKIAANAVTYAKMQTVSPLALLANPTNTAGVVQEVTNALMIYFNGDSQILRLDFMDYCAAEGIDFNNGGDLTVPLQNFIVQCYMFALSQGARSLSDQGPRVRVRAVCNATRPIRITSPIVVPPFVDFDFTTQLLRDGSTGAITPNYTGDPTTKALANLQQPALILSAGAHAANADVNCNPDNVHQGSGFYAVRGWTLSGGAVAGTPTGYTNGDVVTTANYQLSPYSGATFQLTVSGGNVTGITMLTPGYYPMPSVLLRNTWSTANGFNGTKYPQMFDSSGNFVVSGGSGTGLVITPSWTPDWTSPSTQYVADTQAPFVNCLLGNIESRGCGTALDSTYGPMRAAHLEGAYIYFQNITTTGGYIGLSVNALDVLGGTLYNVGALTQFRKFAGSNVRARVVCDTPAAGGRYFDIDQTGDFTLDIGCFNNGSSDLTGTSYSGRVGANTTSGHTISGRLNVQFFNAGTTAGIPALFVDRAQDLDIDVQVINEKDGSPLAYQNTSLIVFGANNGSGNRLSGVATNMAGALYSGPTAGWSIDVADATAGGWMRNAGIYELTGSGAPTGSTGQNKAPIGSTYKDTVTGLSYRNAGSAGSPSWVLGAGGLVPTAVKTSAYTLASQDYVPVDATGGTVPLTLPTAPTDGTTVGAKMIAVSGANVATIACGGSDVFNKTGGSTTLTLSLLNQGALLQYKAAGGIWYVMADDLSLSQLDLRYIPQVNGVTKLSNTAAIQLPKWLAALSRVADGTGNGKLLMIGDSTMMGFGSNPTTVKMRYSGPSKMIAGLLNEAGINATNNGWAGDGGNRGTPSETSQYDDRIVVGAGWSKTGVKFIGGNSFTATSATSDLSYTPKENVDTFVLTYFKFSGGGSFSYNVNGGSNTTQSTNAANSIVTLTITVPAGLGVNAINLNWVSGQVYILGIDAYDSSRNRLSVINAGWDGSQSPDWTGVISVSGTSPYQLGQDLTIICLGINDCNVGTPVATFTANMQQVITAALAAGDVAIMTFTQTDPNAGLASVATQDAFNQAIRGLAVTNNIALIDIYARWQSFAISNAVGLYYDQIHPNGQGYQNQWNAVYGVIGADGLYTSPYGLMDLTIVSGNVTLSDRYGTVGVDTSAGNITITVEAAASSTRRLHNIKKLSGLNTLTIARSGSDTFYTSSPGNTSITATADGQSYSLHADPANNRWLVI